MVEKVSFSFPMKFMRYLNIATAEFYQVKQNIIKHDYKGLSILQETLYRFSDERSVSSYITRR